MKIFLPFSVICVFLSIVPVRAEIPTNVWSDSYGDPSGEHAWGLAVDSQDDILVSGLFYGDLDLGDGLLVGQGEADAFLAKFDGSGDLAWSLSFGSPEYENVASVCTDSLGNVLVAGYMKSSLDLGGGPLSGPGAANIFLAKFTSAGVHLWSQSFGAEDYIQAAENIQTDAAGNVYVAGAFEGTVNFGGAPMTSIDGRDMYIAKFDPAGGHVWSLCFGGAGFHNWYFDGMRVTAAGDVFVVGPGEGTVDLGGGPLVGAGLNDVFVARFDGDGNHVWSRVFGGTNQDSCFRLTLAPASGFYLAGVTFGTIDFGGGVLGSDGQTTSFLVRLDAGGQHLWSTGFAGLWGQEPSLAVDTLGYLYLAGYDNGDIDLGGGVLPGIHGEDAFLACFDSDGGHLWSRRYSGTGHQYFRNVITDGNRDVIVFGDFNDTIDLGGGPMGSAGSLSLDLCLGKLGKLVSNVPGSGGRQRVDMTATPNPFNPQTRISFTAPQRTFLTVKVLDLAGRHVRTLAERIYTPGRHAEDWDGRDAAGRAVATGTYVVQVEGGGVLAMHKVTLLR